MSNGALLVLSGPSGCGKSTLTKAILETIPNVYFSISTTTRQMRKGEQDGVHYHFVDTKQFEADIEKGVFLEWAKVHSNYYGTALKPIKKALSEGKIVLFDVDVQGHSSIKAHFGHVAKSVFITTKDRATLEKRLRARNTDDDKTIALRLETAYKEMQQLGTFDYVLINDDISAAKEAIIAIVRSLVYMQNAHFIEMMKNW